MAFFNDLKIPVIGKDTSGFLTLDNEGKIVPASVGTEEVMNLQSDVTEIKDTLGTVDSKLDEIIGE